MSNLINLSMTIGLVFSFPVSISSSSPGKLLFGCALKDLVSISNLEPISPVKLLNLCKYKESYKVHSALRKSYMVEQNNYPLSLTRLDIRF